MAKRTANKQKGSGVDTCLRCGAEGPLKRGLCIKHYTQCINALKKLELELGKDARDRFERDFMEHGHLGASHRGMRGEPNDYAALVEESMNLLGMM